MSRRIALGAILSLLLLLPTLALATTTSQSSNEPGKYAVPDVGTQGNGLSNTDEHYLNVYVQAYKEFGSEVGRNIVDDGLNKPGNPAPSDAQIQEGITRMDTMLHPPPTPQPVAQSTSTSTATSTYSAPTPQPTATSTSSGCSGMEAESGTAGYSAVNSSSGAYGCYQIMPETAANYGCDLSTPGGQDACKDEICADVGNGAWSASGATPCG